MPELVPSSSAIAIISYLLLCMGPGLLVGVSAGLRGWLLVATSPLLTYGVAGLAGPVLPFFGISWNPPTMLACAAVLAVIAVSARTAFGRVRPQVRSGTGAHEPWATTDHVGVAASVALAATIGALVTISATRNFTAIPQIWDAVFHGNATYFISETGLSSPAALRALNEPTVASYYYPNAYHLIVAAFVMFTGQAVTAALEVSFAVIPGFIAIGMAALIRSLGGRPALAGVAAILSCGFTAFPYDLMPWGTLLPFLTAVALLPAFAALWARLLQTNSATPYARAAVLGLAGVGIIGLHPSVAVAAVLIGGALLIQEWLTRKPKSSDFRIIGTTVVAAGILGAPLILASAAVAAGPAYDWPTTLLPADALGQVLFQSHAQQFPQWWLALLVLAGLMSLRRSPQLIPIAIVGLTFAGLFMLAASYEGPAVELLTRPWWNDKWRLAGLWTLCAIPIAAVGVIRICDLLVRPLHWLQRIIFSTADRRWGRTISTATLLAVLALLVQATDGLYAERNTARLSQAFADGPTVSRDEAAAFEVLAQMNPAGALVMNDPYDGSAWMWALAGVQPVFATPVIAGNELPIMETNRKILFNSFNELDDNRIVQVAVENLGIRYVILCKGFIAPASDHVPGMQELDTVKSLQPVFENADAVIYEISQPPDTSLG